MRLTLYSLDQVEDGIEEAGAGTGRRRAARWWGSSRTGRRTGRRRRRHDGAAAASATGSTDGGVASVLHTPGRAATLSARHTTPMNHLAGAGDGDSSR